MDVAAVKCRMCKVEKMWILGQPGALAFICPRCDSAPATNPGNRLWATAPNAAGTKNGWFLPSAGWMT